MQYLKEWTEFNPVLDQEVDDYVSMNKYNLPELWDKDLSEEENINFMLDYFKKYPNEMNHSINPKKIKKASQKSNSLDYVPILQNIGGVYDFKAF